MGTVGIATLAVIVGAVIGWWFGRRTLSNALSRTLERSPRTADEPRASAGDIAYRLDREVASLLGERDDAEDHRQLLGAALESGTDAVSIADATGNEIYANRALRELRGLNTVGALVAGDIANAHAAVRDSGSFGGDIEIFGPPRRVYALSAHPAPDTHTVVIVRDNTALARCEQVRRDFVANVSHELQTPVAAVSLLAETTVDETDPDVQRQLAAQLVAEATRLSRIIDELLELNRLEQLPHHDAEPVSVATVVDEAVERHRYGASEAGVAVKLDPIDDELAVVGDRPLLVSAVGNLIGNAIKYSPQGTVHVSAQLRGDRAVVLVSDDGIGIPRGDLERVFERFYRVDRSRSIATGGTGLGLSLVRHIVEDHGGRVTVESVEGEGSTFRLDLPAVRTSSPEPNGTDSPGSNGSDSLDGARANGAA